MSKRVTKKKKSQQHWKEKRGIVLVNKNINPFPSRYRTKLTFQKNTQIFNNVAYANVRFIPTYVYDVDPTLGSTALPFFTELAGIYRFYRLIHSRITVSASNLDAGVLGTVYVCPVNADPTQNTANFQNYLSNPRCKSKTIGFANGNGSMQKISSFLGIDEFSGVVWTGQIDAYSANTSGTAPPNNAYWNIGYLANTTIVNGIFADIKLILEIEFFELTTPGT